MYHVQVRKELIDFNYQRRNGNWAGILGTAEEMEAYVDEHRKPAVWSNSVEPVFAARLCYVNFILYKPFEKPRRVRFSAAYEDVCFRFGCNKSITPVFRSALFFSNT